MSGEKVESKAALELSGAIPVLVTTEHRGVFFGYADRTDLEASPRVLKVKRVRNVVYWTAESHGFLGLAIMGPHTGCKIGPAAPSGTIHAITGVWTCTPEAVTAWEAEPWS